MTHFLYLVRHGEADQPTAVDNHKCVTAPMASRRARE